MAKLPETKDLVWTTKDGRHIQVCDMSEEHAKNCLRLLMRRIMVINQTKFQALDEITDHHNGMI